MKIDEMEDDFWLRTFITLAPFSSYGAIADL